MATHLVFMNDYTLHFLTLANKYLLLVQSILKESIKSGNKWMVDEGNCNELTKWSDFNIFPATLFNFYHGIELLMKGLILSENLEFKPNHQLKDLLKKIKTESNIDPRIIMRLEEYVLKEKMSNQELKDFFQDNNSSPNKFFDILKYPTTKNLTKDYNFFRLKYRQEKFIPLFKKIISDITKVNNGVIEYAREKGKL